MNINVYPIVSEMDEQLTVDADTEQLINDLAYSTNASIKIVNKISKFYDADLSLILIQSGGTESKFLKKFKSFKEPYYLLTYGTSNSLAASMEILSYLKQMCLEAEILHGSSNYIAGRISELVARNNKNIVNLGVIGKPSDWLIASDVNYHAVYNRYKVNLIDIPIDELITEYENANSLDFKCNYPLEYEPYELSRSIRLKRAFDVIVKKYNLKGFTIRCFDLINSINTTACLSLGLFNSCNTVAACEGDIPSMLSMFVSNRVTGQSGFMANPSSIDIDHCEMVFAHCSCPLKMTNSFTLDSHFESGKGVAIKGEFKETKVTILKISNNLKNYFVTTGTIIGNLNCHNLCRTQIKVKIDHDINYFLKNPFGNHHIIIYGDHERLIRGYMNLL